METVPSPAFDARPKGLLRRGLEHLPQGHTLPELSWRFRHRWILALLFAQIVGLAAFGLSRGFDIEHVGLEISGLLLIAAFASWPRLGRRFRACMASVGLITCSALFVHLSGGYIEAHFHFFVMLGVIVLYEDWIPFLLSIGYVAVHHGIVGTFDPRSVYNHPDAIAHPWIWASIHAVFILWLSAALVLYWRISERLRAHNELVLKSSGTGIVGLDTLGQVTFANAAAARLAGSSVEALVGKPFAAFLDGGRPVGGGQGAAIGAIRGAGGAPTPVEWASSPIVENGREVGRVVTLTDIRERLEADQELRASEERYRSLAAELDERVKQRTRELESRTRELEEAMRELEAFNYSVSHDLRSPLRVIRGFSEALLENSGDSLDANAHKHLVHVYDASARMSRTIEALLQLSRINRTEVRRERVDLSQMGADIVAQLRTEDPQRQVDAQVQPGLLDAADPALAAVVLQNLLSNAFKFTRGRAAAHVQLGAVDEPDGRWYFVRDNGAGFSEQDAARLFRPFERLHNPAQFEGTGIGLATVARILRRHGGAFRAEGRPDEGATFFFRFDAPTMSPAPTRPATVSHTNGTKPVAPPRPTIGVPTTR